MAHGAGLRPGGADYSTRFIEPKRPGKAPPPSGGAGGRMKTIIKIVIGVVVITACFNASRASLNNYQFQDAVHEGLIFDGRASDEEIVDMIGKLASAFDIPLDADNIHIRQVGQEVQVDMSYTRNVVLVPGFFERPWTFTPSTSTRILTGSRRQ